MSEWRLYFRGLQPEQLAGTFFREGRMVDKRALRQMRTVSKLVMEQSQRNTPVDWKGYTSKDPPGYELERSHRIEEQYNHGRIEATVTVGGMVGDVNTDLYAMWIHEGDYHLGKASIAKTMRGPKYKVGPEFLTRALAEYESEFDSLLDELVEGLMQ
jgi:hypothetical protein